MEPKFQTSFIPKQSLAESATGRKPRRNASIFTIIALVVFLGSLAAAIGVFLYIQLLNQNIASKKADLERAKNEFQQALIQKLSRLDQRIIISEGLLRDHIAFSALFTLLQSYTLQNVRFEILKYDNQGPTKTTLTMHGSAKSFAALALQSEVFGKIPFLKDPIFANPNLDEKGNVKFDFHTTLDPALLSYAASLNSGSAPEENEVLSPPQTSPTTP
ncbi:MAG TPA: hypothetical protein VJI74_02105 [Candidatus Paceibacterota bacterium]